MERICASVPADSAEPTSARDIANNLGMPVQAVDAVVVFGVSSRSLTLIEGWIWTAGQLEYVAGVLKADHGRRSFTIGDIRRRFGLPRRAGDLLFDRLVAWELVVESDDGWIVKP